MKTKTRGDENSIALKSPSSMVLMAFILIGVALTSFLFLTWFFNGVLGVSNIYVVVLYVIQSTYVILISILIPITIRKYKKKEKEVTTLTEAIQRVAAGDYKTKLPIDTKMELAVIYEDFNKMCEELESVQILRNDFINNYSHEFKTPIASINGFASLLLEKNLDEEKRRQFLGIIVEESARLSNMAVNTILLSKLTSQQIVTDMETYDLSEQLRQCSILLSQKWLDKRIEFNAELTPLTFVANKEMLQHLWINLIDNAIKYTPIGGEIMVKNYKEEDMAIIEISDTGEGMDETAMQHLFEPYYQADTSHAAQGLGLGLSIVKRIVELYKGKITVHSEVSVGTTFIVQLPCK